jgi:capsular polysaccharide transport system permease protein
MQDSPPAPAAKPQAAAAAKERLALSEKVVVRPLASPARVRKRHKGLFAAFVICAILPVAAAAWYLYNRAADQYASTVAFTVRSEDISSAADLLGGLGGALGGGSGGSSDSDILYEFIRSQEMVANLDVQLDLRRLYTAHRDTDPLLSFHPDGTIEDLTSYWQRMVRISYDAGTGLMELRVLAFDPAQAKLIAEAIFGESTRMINALSAIAREDATRYAREDLELAVERVKATREALTSFRVATQIVDPTADLQGQMGLLNTLQAQLAEALIEMDLLSNSSRAGDPRLEQAKRRIEVIESRIAAERRKFGVGAPGDKSYATTIAEFERLAVEREFAEQTYSVARSTYDAARAEANRKSRYLAAYINPTLAEKAEFPQRVLIVGMVALFAFLIWAIGALVYYSLRDRR